MFAERNLNSVLIVSSTDKSADYLAGVLPTDKFSPVVTVKNAGEAKRKLVDNVFDIVIINSPLSDEFGVQLAIDLSVPGTSGILVLVKSEVFEQVSFKVEDYGVLTVAKPTNRQVITQTVNLLAATRRRMKALENKALTLEAKMAEIRLVNRAKIVLMRELKMTEPEAHRFIEKSAMDMCIKKGEVAKNILTTYDTQ